jgi:hypothetical protein
VERSLGILANIAEGSKKLRKELKRRIATIGE